MNKIDQSFRHGENLQLGDFIIIQEGCEVGDNVQIGNYVRLAKETKIGDNTRIDHYVRSSGNNKIGSNVVLRYGSTIAREVTVEDGVFISPNVMTIYVTHKGLKMGGTVIGEGSFIGTNAVLGPNLKIGKKVVVGSLASVMGETIGDGTIIYNLAHISHADIGKKCRIGLSAVIGSLGLWVKRQENHSLERVKAEGKVKLGDGVDVGAHTCIHRGVTGNTVVRDGTFIGPMCNLGHDVKVGKNCIIITGTILCGYADIGDRTRINPGSMVSDRKKVGSDTTIGIGSLVLDNIPSNAVAYGRPAKVRNNHLLKS